MTVSCTGHGSLLLACNLHRDAPGGWALPSSSFAEMASSVRRPRPAVSIAPTRCRTCLYRNPLPSTCTGFKPYAYAYTALHIAPHMMWLKCYVRGCAEVFATTSMRKPLGRSTTSHRESRLTGCRYSLAGDKLANCVKSCVPRNSAAASLWTAQSMMFDVSTLLFIDLHDVLLQGSGGLASTPKVREAHRRSLMSTAFDTCWRYIRQKGSATAAVLTQKWYSFPIALQPACWLHLPGDNAGVSHPPNR